MKSSFSYRKGVTNLPPIITTRSSHIDSLYYQIRGQPTSLDSPSAFRIPHTPNSSSPTKAKTSRNTSRKTTFNPFSFSSKDVEREYKTIHELKKQINTRIETTERGEEVEEETDNTLIQKHVNSQIRKFAQVQINDILGEGYMLKLEKQLAEKIILMAEKILLLYGISPVLVYTSKIDSIMIIEPLTEVSNLAQCYRAILPELCKFPYTFFKSLTLMTLNFVDEYQLLKPESNPLTQKKLYTGLFPVQTFKTENDAKLYFYKTVAFLLKGKHATLDDEWAEITPPPKEIKLVYKGTKVMAKPRDVLEEQAEFLMKFIQEPRRCFQSNSDLEVAQAGLFQSIMEEVDPVGINQKWWKDLAFLNFRRQV